jgi:hypothetical protein
MGPGGKMATVNNSRFGLACHVPFTTWSNFGLACPFSNYHALQVWFALSYTSHHVVQVWYGLSAFSHQVVNKLNIMVTVVHLFLLLISSTAARPGAKNENGDRPFSV